MTAVATGQRKGQWRQALDDGLVITWRYLKRIPRIPELAIGIPGLGPMPETDALGPLAVAVAYLGCQDVLENLAVADGDRGGVEPRRVRGVEQDSRLRTVFEVVLGDLERLEVEGAMHGDRVTHLHG